MTTTQHTITTKVKVNVESAGCQDTLKPEIEITYSYTPGKDLDVADLARAAYVALPAKRELAARLINAYDDDLTVMDAKLLDADGVNPTDEQVRQWAEDWLCDAGFDEALSLAKEQRQ